MLLSLVLLFGLCIWFWFNWRYYYWKRHGIPGPEPTWIVGNMGPALRMKKHFDAIILDYCRQFADFPYCGYFKWFRPAILIRDPSIVSNIMIKDFRYFSSNEFGLNKYGDQWKHSPAFTLNEMRTIFPLIRNTCEKLEKYINSKDVGHDYDSNDLAVKFITDNVAMCGFSIEAESFTNQNSEFCKLGPHQSTVMNAIKMSLAKICPSLLEILPVPWVSREIEVWLGKVILQNLKSRNNIKLQQEDFLEMLLQTVDKPGPTFNNRDLEIIANSLISYVTEGFQTSCAVLSFALFELAQHQNEQNVLYNEIGQILGENQLSMDHLQKITYLDLVLSETMRIHQAVFVLNKVCTKDYPLPPYPGQTTGFVIPRGMPVTLPMEPPKNDENYFPNSNRFGEGPPCQFVGMQFGQIQIKAALATICKSYRVTLSPKCKHTIEYDPKSLRNLSSVPILLNFTQRE